MKFSDFPYVRPDVPAVCAGFEGLTAQFQKSTTPLEQIEIIRQYRDLLGKFNSMKVIASIRYTINTQDEFYAGEDKFFNQNLPTVDKAMVAFGQAILKSQFIPLIKAEFGDIFITNIEFKSRSMCPEIISLMQEENALNSEYQTFNARAKIPFRGEDCTIPGITLHMNSDDRDTRREAYKAFSDFYCKNGEFYDTVYDKLVKNRTAQARGMGLETYTQLGYIRRNRNCFTPEDVTVFRKQVVEDIVPAVTAMKKRQAARIKLPDMKVYDGDLYFADGNPKTFESAEDMMKATKEVFSELSPITKEFIEFMMEGENYDAPSRIGKRVGAYCNYIPDHKAPFVFLNYNGSAAEVTTTFHEFGHAFNTFCMRQDPYGILKSPTLDIAEIHSMSMEFITEPGYGKFFSPADVLKQKTSHLEHCLAFIAYGTMVDEFQHVVYDNPDMTPAERNKAWLELDLKYRPHMDFDGIELYATGRTWQRQQHLFSAPFYYIDYVLAQTIALQFWEIGLTDQKKAFDKYVELTKKGGSLTFVDLVNSVDLKVPFKPGSLKAIAQAVEKTM